MSFEAGCLRLVHFIDRKQSLYVYSVSGRTSAKVKNVAEVVTGRLKLCGSLKFYLMRSLCKLCAEVD